MGTIAKAKVGWLTPEEGGRKTDWTGMVYYAVSDFEEYRDSAQSLWSLVVEFDEPPTVGTQVNARVRFLVDRAPTRLLHSESRFNLMEGSRVVATGEII